MKLSRAAIAGLVAAVVLVAGVGWYFASPALTLRGMKAAAEAKDPDALNAYVDYPALREDLKAELMAQFLAESQKEKFGFGALGMAMGTAMLGPMIDNIVSPAGMRAAMIADRNKPKGAPAPKGATSALQVPDEPVIVRRNFSEFLVATKKEPNSGLVFKRQGLSWKLSGIDLPPSALATQDPAR